MGALGRARFQVAPGGHARRRAVGLEALVGPIVNGGRPWDIASRTFDSHVLVSVIRSGQPRFAGLSGTAGQASEAGPDPPPKNTKQIK